MFSEWHYTVYVTLLAKLWQAVIYFWMLMGIMRQWSKELEIAKLQSIIFRYNNPQHLEELLLIFSNVDKSDPKIVPSKRLINWIFSIVILENKQPFVVIKQIHSMTGAVCSLLMNAAHWLLSMESFGTG